MRGPVGQREPLLACSNGPSRGHGAQIAPHHSRETESSAARGAGAIGVHYNASKAGMEGLTRGYAARLVKEGITVNAVAPSLIATDMMGGRTDLARNIPLGRMGQADEVAQAVAMGLGNSYMTGQTIVLNGGMAFI